MAITTQTSGTGASSSTTPSVTVPGTPASGDLLIGIIARDLTAGITDWGGWTQLQFVSNPSQCTLAVAYKVAAGGETAWVPTYSATERSCHICIRIPTGEWHGTTPPESSAGATGSSATPDPDTCTPSGWSSASEQTRWFAIASMDDNVNCGTVTFDAGWPDHNIAHETTSASSALAALMSVQAAAASQNPGTFGQAQVDDWACCTIAVRLAVAAKAPPFAPKFPAAVLAM